MKKLFVVFIVLLFAAPALAVDWNFYGSARMATYWVDTELGEVAGVQQTTVGGDDDDQDLQWDLQGNSRIGARVKADAVGGRFEFGINEATVTSRLIFGTWNFGPGTLLVGKDYTPISQFISGQAFNGDIGLLGVGTAYGSRVGQLKLSFGGFQLALITPSSSDKGSGGDVDEWLPKIEASFGMGFDMFNFKVMGGYQTWNVDLANDDFDIDSWIVGLDAGVNFGPAYVKGAVSYAQNPTDAGWNIGGLFTAAAASSATVVGSNVDDATSLMWAVVGGFKFTDAMWVEAGFGWREDDPDVSGLDQDDAWSAYIQLPMALAPGMWVIPEFGYYDFGDDTANDDDGTQWYLGGKWQIDF